MPPSAAVLAFGFGAALLELTPSLALAAPHASAQRWTQDMFAISDWQPPFVHGGPDWEVQADQRYADFAAANFTVMLGGLNANTSQGACMCIKGTEACCGDTSAAVQMRLCEKHGLKCVPGYRCNPTGGPSGGPLVEKIDPAATSSPAFWGFDVMDEPSAHQFPTLRDVSDQIAVLYPAGRLRFINLLPNYASSAQYNATNYTAYVNLFVEQVKPDVLCMDHCARPYRTLHASEHWHLSVPARRIES